MRFTKMHGLGNDYLYVFGTPQNPQEQSVRLSDRHFGAGSDGMIWIAPSEKADFRMSIFNADGSEAEMCGNGIRCVGKFVYDKGLTNKTRLTVETKAGLRELELVLDDGKVSGASVNMGAASVGSPFTLTASGVELECIPVSVGNPHAVVFVPDAEKLRLSVLGKALSCHSGFPDGVNAEFVQVIDPQTLRMRVWERGSGVTLACGTGACASVAAAVSADLCKRGKPIKVRLDGGELSVTMREDGTMYMTGPAVTVYEGETEE